MSLKDFKALTLKAGLAKVREWTFEMERELSALTNESAPVTDPSTDSQKGRGSDKPDKVAPKRAVKELGLVKPRPRKLADSASSSKSVERPKAPGRTKASGICRCGAFISKKRYQKYDGTLHDIDVCGPCQRPVAECTCNPVTPR